MLNEALALSEWEKCRHPVIALDETRLKLPASDPQVNVQVHYVIHYIIMSFFIILTYLILCKVVV